MTNIKNDKQVKNNKGLIITSAIGAVIVAGYVFLCVIAGGKDFIGNTVINGIDVSEMSKQEAITALQSQYTSNNLNTLTLSVNNDKQVTINTENALSFDANKGVEDIYSKHHSSFFNQGMLLFSSNEYIIPVEIKDQSIIENGIKDSGILDYNTAVATTYNLLDTEIEFVKGKEGVKVSLDSLMKDVKDALSQYKVADAIVCTLEKSGLEADEMTKFHTELNKEMLNATLDRSNNYAIVPSQVGVSYSLEEAQKAFDNAQEGETFKVAATVQKPTVTTQDLKNNLFKHTLSSYTTKVGGRSERRSNVKLAGKKCNGTILLPGEEFSFNRVVGKRTAAAGFQAATAYVGGKDVDTIGGGVCQTATTIYNAAMYANMKITARQPHSYPSGYVPWGQDATVSWGSIDFKFKNTSDYPIKLVTSYNNDRLTVKIYGTNLEKITVKITSKTLSTKPYITIEKPDPNLEVGKKITEVSGYEGGTAQTYRHVYKNGKLISSRKEAYSSYKKRDKVVIIGTKPVDPEPSNPDPSDPVNPTPPSDDNVVG